MAYHTSQVLSFSIFNNSQTYLSDPKWPANANTIEFYQVAMSSLILHYLLNIHVIKLRSTSDIYLIIIKVLQSIKMICNKTSKFSFHYDFQIMLILFKDDILITQSSYSWHCRSFKAQNVMPLRCGLIHV